MAEKKSSFFQDKDGYIYQVSDYFTGEIKQPEGMTPIEEPEPYKFELESISFKTVLTYPTDLILDFYSHYHALYQLTGETQFEARAKVYKQAFQTKTKIQEVS